MVDDLVPEDVKQFILQTIDSVAQMECLLIFLAQPGQALEAETVAKGLYIGVPQAEVILAQLIRQGFLVTVEEGSMLHYRYQPQSAELGRMMERTASLYRQYLVPITHLIHSKPKSRVQAFADAFRLRKD